MRLFACQYIIYPVIKAVNQANSTYLQRHTWLFSSKTICGVVSIPIKQDNPNTYDGKRFDRELMYHLNKSKTPLNRSNVELDYSI